MDYIRLLRNHVGTPAQSVFDSKDRSSHLLNGIWANMTSLSMLIEWRFSRFHPQFRQAIAEREGLFYKNGYYYDQAGYEYREKTDHNVDKFKFEQLDIPRTTPITSFWDRTPEKHDDNDRSGR